MTDSLVSFIKWFLIGRDKIDGNKGKHIDSVVNSLVSTLMYNVKTARQAKYTPKSPSTALFRHTNENLHVWD